MTEWLSFCGSIVTEGIQAVFLQREYKIHGFLTMFGMAKRLSFRRSVATVSSEGLRSASRLFFEQHCSSLFLLNIIGTEIQKKRR
jgi:hypothetical protein